MRKILILSCLLLACTAQAEVYRWVDKDGVVHYTDQPPDKAAKPAVLPPLQTISSGVAAAAPPEAQPPAGEARVIAAGSYKVSVLAPLADETLRSAERRISVRVGVDPPVPEGGGFIYYLDGRPQNSVGAATSFELSGVERGSHLVAVALVDGAGRELGRSAPVIVHMKPPTAR